MSNLKVPRFDGKQDIERRQRAEATRSLILPGGQSMTVLPYMKTIPTYAARISQDFEVETLEGVMEGRAGDWLAIGIVGEMYPIADVVMQKSFAPMPAQPLNPRPPSVEDQLESLRHQMAATESGELRVAMGCVEAALMLVRIWAARNG